MGGFRGRKGWQEVVKLKLCCSRCEARGKSIMGRLLWDIDLGFRLPHYKHGPSFDGFWKLGGPTSTMLTKASMVLTLPSPLQLTHRSPLRLSPCFEMSKTSCMKHKHESLSPVWGQTTLSGSKWWKMGEICSPVDACQRI